MSEMMPEGFEIVRYEHGGGRIWINKPGGGRDLVMDLYACDGPDPAARREAIIAAVTRPATATDLARLAEAWARAAEQLGMDRCNYATSGNAARSCVDAARTAFLTAFAALQAAVGKLRTDNAAMMKQIEESQMGRLAKGDALLANKAPHRCPVCEGRGQVLFNPDLPHSSGTSCGPWICRPCMGSGILWTVDFTDDLSAAPHRKAGDG